MLVLIREGKKGRKMDMGRKEIEEIHEFKYLSFMILNKDSYKEHIRELSRKGRMAARKVWSLGERICRNDFKTR